MTRQEATAYRAPLPPMWTASRGDYNNVVGLPVSAVYQALKKLESEREAGES